MIDRITDDELEQLYRDPGTITSRQVVATIYELYERRAADDTATGISKESIQPFRDALKPQLDESKDLLLAVEMVLRDASQIIDGATSNYNAGFVPSIPQVRAEATRVLKLVREFRSNLP